MRAYLYISTNNLGIIPRRHLPYTYRKEDRELLRAADHFRAMPWPVLVTAAARCIAAMANKCLGAPHTPSLPAKSASDYSQGCHL